jgi:uncharacterized membrane protein
MGWYGDLWSWAADSGFMALALVVVLHAWALVVLMGLAGMTYEKVTGKKLKDAFR